ncbi:MAG: AI-2E family transporter [Eubacteriales bacterium]|nr:AI-2E family transporter [Eubacteriales bacterium]
MKQKYSNWFLAFIFLSGIIIVYKTVDNFNFIFDYIGKIISTLSPFITGFIIAYLLNTPIKKFQGVVAKSKSSFLIKHSKGVSITAIYLILLIAITIILRLIVPAISKNLVDLYYSIPGYLSDILQKLTALQERFDINILSFNKEDTIAAIQGFIKNFNLSEVGKYAQGVITLTSGVIATFIAIIVSVYMLADKQIIAAGIKRVLNVFLPHEKVDKFTEYAARTNDIFSKYIFSVVMDGLIIGILSTILMSILRVKYSFVLGLLMGVLSLIPYFGAIVAVALCIIVTLLTGGFFRALWVAIALIILQQIDGNFIGPKIMGNMLKARPLLIIFAVTLGGGLFGIWGMLLSVPIVMVIKMLLSDFISAKEAEKAVKNE